MLTYDPPSGWRYGFPRPYQPLPDESLHDTLIRDGYPRQHAEFACQYCRFIGSEAELEAMFPSPPRPEMQLELPFD